MKSKRSQKVEVTILVMRGKAYLRLFFIICLIVLSFILIHVQFGEDDRYVTQLADETDLLCNGTNNSEVPGWEFNISRNLNDYIHYEAMTATILPKDFCDKPSFIVIMCISSPSSFKAREVIRRTWGHERSVVGYNVSLYFLLGLTTDLALQKNITDESSLFGDIVQENFYDTYNNLTLKSAMMLKLFSMKCNASYLFKIDDDVYLNLPRLIDDLVTRNKTENLLMGSVICKSKPIRYSRDKWYAGPTSLFPYKVYPNYISGTSYCMSGDVARKLLKVALSTPIFHLEDVYLTGICSKKIGLNLTHNGRFTYHDLTLLPRNLCLYKVLITVHYQEPKSIQNIHDAFHNSKVEKDCQKPEQVAFVRKYVMNMVLMTNKTRRGKSCPY